MRRHPSLWPAPPEELPVAFLEILDGFRELNRQLEAELGLNKLVPIYPLPNEWRRLHNAGRI